MKKMNNKLTKFQAIYIYYLRSKLRYTWRAVHREYCTRYKFNLPFNSDKINEIRKSSTIHIGNQLDGMFLCKEASELLGITVD